VRRLQFLPRGRRRPLLCWSGAEWGSVRTQMLSSFVGSRRSSRRSVICASLFGVGAPEALVIGVVALLVFGPKGLAEVNLRIQPCQLYSFCSGSYFTLYYCACEVLEIEKH